MEAYQQLERDFARWVGLDQRGMVVCSSGTAALHLALEALRLQPGSEVLVPDFTMIACARAVTLAGLTPVFVDCDERLLMAPGFVEEGFNTDSGDRPAAVMAVHIYGRRCDMDAIHEWTKVVYDAVLIEDLAEAHGVRPHPQTDAACWSFFRNKIIAGEEGGAVWFRNPEHAELARSLRCLGFTPEHDFNHIPRGHNYRLSNAHALPILASLACADQSIVVRSLVESRYDALCPPAWRMPPRQAPWVYDLRIPGLTAERQNAIVRALNERGIAARHGFKPMSEQEEYRGCRVIGNGNALRLSREVIYLPLAFECDEAEGAMRLLQEIVG